MRSEKLKYLHLTQTQSLQCNKETYGTSLFFPTVSMVLTISNIKNDSWFSICPYHRNEKYLALSEQSIKRVCYQVDAITVRKTLITNKNVFHTWEWNIQNDSYKLSTFIASEFLPRLQLTISRRKWQFCRFLELDKFTNGSNTVRSGRFYNLGVDIGVLFCRLPPRDFSHKER